MRFHGRRVAAALVGSLALLPGIGTSAAPAAAAQPTAGGLPSAPIHAAAPHVTPLLPPGPQRFAVPSGAHANYYGGPVMSNVSVVMVLYGAGNYESHIASPAAPSMASFYGQATNSSYVDWLSEYNTNFAGGSNQSIGRGSFAGVVTITPSAANSGTLIDDSQIKSELVAQVYAGNLPAPTHDAAGWNNTLYAIFFPHGTAITQGGYRSCVAGGFAAYHGTTRIGASHAIEYAVQPDFQAGSGCEFGTGNGTTFQNEMSVASHELVEAITDPQVGFATQIGPPLAWYDPNYGEIGDTCNGQQAPLTGADGNSYTVQKQFSNVAGACISARASVATSTALSSTPVNPGVGDPVTLQAVVTSSAQGFPLGTVQFGVNGSDVGAPVALANGVASSQPINNLPGGATPISAVYTPASTAWSGSSQSGVVNVTPIATKTTMTATLSGTFGQPLPVTVSVATDPSSSLVPDGSVQFTVDGSPLGSPVTLANGTVSSVVTPPVGTHQLGATYVPGANFTTSAATPVKVRITRAGSVLALTSSLNSAPAGASVTFTATMSAKSPSTAVPTGFVSFTLRGTTLATVALVNGVATFTTSTLPVGKNAVHAVYAGNTSMRPSRQRFNEIITP
ncbi:MAG: hypothetical protein JWL83_1861 [Actinomycetia bacterium]|nr:hypothetical protein [Actinomycetes bacterium]